MNSLLVRGREKIKETRLSLASAGYYDNTRRISQLDGEECFALPVTSTAVAELPVTTDNQNHTAHFNGSIHTLIHTNLPMSKGAIAKTKTESESLKTSLRLLLLNGLTPPLNGSECEALVSTVPMSWERHSDLVVLPSHAFISAEWKRVQQDSPEFWSTVATALRCRRLARGSEISCDKYRSSCAVMLKGDDPWVEHNDNGIKYVFDVTHIMFSSGNIVEKLRLAEFDCRGQTIVDMYAGIGYFTLPYLVHAHADTVHACEWNPKAIEGLRRGLIANGVSERCIIHEGDCREVCPRGIADRVNLGLIPSSEGGWETACIALRSDRGGWLYIHGNVSWRPGKTILACNPWEDGESGDRERGEHRENSDSGDKSVLELRDEAKTNWKQYIEVRIRSLLLKVNPLNVGWIWDACVRRVGNVKSYAPFVDHLVADVECRPVGSNTGTSMGPSH